MLEDMGDIEKCKLKFNKHIGKRSPTSIAEFTNGKVKLQTLERNVPTLHFEKYRSAMESNSGSDMRILNATNGRLNYCGESLLTNGAHRYFVGIRNKRSGKMKLYDTDFFRLKPMLMPPEVNQEKKKVNNEKKNYRENVDDLISHFGSKISKRIVNSRLKSIVDPKHMEKSLNNLEIDASVSMSPVNPADSIDYIPSRNIEASTPAEVYDINDIIPKEDYDSLGDEAERLMRATSEDISQWNEEKVYCNYVLSHIKAGLKDIRQAKYLVYYNIMAQFIKLKYSDIHTKNPAKGIPEPYRERLLNNFTVVSDVRTQRSFPLKMKDKLLSHMIVLALFIDDFCADPGLIADDLSFSSRKVLTISKVLGCYEKVKTTPVTVKLIVLRLPLNTLDPKPFRRKKF